MKKFLTILVLCVSALAQEPYRQIGTNTICGTVTYSIEPLAKDAKRPEFNYAAPKEHQSIWKWPARHPVASAFIAAGGIVVGWKLEHPIYKCYSDAGTEGVYGTYTGTPSGQKGPHGCPVDQKARHYFGLF